jgi:hypothetical protein
MKGYQDCWQTMVPPIVWDVFQALLFDFDTRSEPSRFFLNREQLRERRRSGTVVHWLSPGRVIRPAMYCSVRLDQQTVINDLTSVDLCFVCDWWRYVPCQKSTESAPGEFPPMNSMNWHSVRFLFQIGWFKFCRGSPSVPVLTDDRVLRSVRVLGPLLHIWPRFPMLLEYSVLKDWTETWLVKNCHLIISDHSCRFATYSIWSPLWSNPTYWLVPLETLNKLFLTICYWIECSSLDFSWPVVERRGHCSLLFTHQRIPKGNGVYVRSDLFPCQAWPKNDSERISDLARPDQYIASWGLGLNTGIQQHDDSQDICNGWLGRLLRYILLTSQALRKSH